MRERIFGWVKAHKVWSSIIGVLVLFAIGIAAGSAHSTTGTTVANQPPAATAPATQTSTPPPAPSPSPTSSPSGTDTGSCAYTLGNTPADDSYLTGEIDVDNTGNIGIVVKVTISWPQEGFSPITETKTVTVPYGNSDYPVEFSDDVGSIDSNGEPAITNIQNWEQGHNYPSNDCTYKADIINTSGTVQ